MFQLDDKFLNDIGLHDLPEDQKPAFLQHIYEELELRVGTKLSEGLSDDQLGQFEKIVDQDQPTIDTWLDNNAPDYPADPTFIRIQESTSLDPNDPKLKAEYSATKWLEINRPDYRQVVAEVLDSLKKEIVSNRDSILGKQ
ncbi:MAG: DUF5663 domain-containing protein [bacterium]|nr:DUF5663 domain-containing protein [bacterium]